MSDNIPANERPQNTISNPAPRGLSYNSGALWTGIVLIGIGGVFLLQNLGIISGSFNWWALFILFPGLAMLYRAFQGYQEGGALSAIHRGTLIGGIATTMVAVIFLFGLSWAVMWPVMLIMIGVGFFLTATR